MSGVLRSLVGAVALWMLAAAPAGAALIPRAEEGAVPLLYNGDPVLGHVAVVAKGETAWSEEVLPAKVVRTLGDVAKRIRPAAPAVPTGSVLFGYKLSTGYAYCPRFEDRPAGREVQCFRDLDGDGTFDVGYVTERYGDRSQVLAAFVHDLQPLGKLPYKAADPSESFKVRMAWIFDGYHKGKPSFRATLDGERIEGRWLCEPNGEGVCVVCGRGLSVRAQGDRVRIELLPMIEPGKSA